MTKLSIEEILKISWDKTKSNIGVLIGVTIIFYFLSVAGSSIGESIAIVNPAAGALIYIVSALLTIMVYAGMIKISLKICDNQPALLSDLFPGTKVFWDYTVALSYYSLILFAGTILLVIPAIIWGVAYQLFPYVVMDNSSGAWQSIKKSGKITMGVRNQLLWLDLLYIFLNFLGLLFFGIGILITYPMSLMGFACVYRKLRKQTEETPPSEPAELKKTEPIKPE